LDELTAWLQAYGLERYASLLAEHEVDLDALKLLDANDLETMGLPLGPRKKFLHGIAQLNRGSTGAGLATSQPAPPTPTGQPAERRQITLLFCDLVGSTELSARLDPENLRTVMDAYQRACAAVVDRYEGHIAQYRGDGIMVYFGWPRAHEDDAERAVRAALELVDAVKSVPAPTQLSVHIGVASGFVVVGEGTLENPSVSDLAVGETPNLAARLEALALPDHVVIAPSTHKLVGQVFICEDLGVHALKGIPQPVRAARVLALRQTEGRFEAMRSSELGPMVGRETEIGILLRHWRQTREGKGQVVLLCGEAGIGKSRISQALREQIADEPHSRLRYQCSPYHVNSAFYPILEHLQRAANFRDEDDIQTKRGRLEHLLTNNGLAHALPLVAELLSMPRDEHHPALDYTPQKQKEETIKLLGHQLAALSREAPLLVVLEDAHWVDPSTLDAFDQVISRIADRRILILITCRPEFKARWTDQNHVAILTLNRLDKNQTLELARQVAGNQALSDVLVEQIAEKTDGIPLFVEELTKSVVELGLAQNERLPDGTAASMSVFAIPTTLRDSLMARLDRLTPVREVAQVGACIGREFDYQLLSMVSLVQPPKLDQALAELVQSGLVFQHGSWPATSYVFKHALVRDAAYESLLKSRRVQLHAQIARTLEERFPQTRERHPDLLALHYTQGADSERAVRYWKKAGDQAAVRSAHYESVAHFEKALEVLRTLPRTAQTLATELELQIALGWAYSAFKSWSAPEVDRAFTRAQALSAEMGDSTPRMALLGLWGFHTVRGDQGVATQFAEQALVSAQENANLGLTVQAMAAVGQCKWLQGDLAGGRLHLAAASELCNSNVSGTLVREFGLAPQPMVLRYFSPALCLAGYPGQALAMAKKAAELGRAMPSAFVELLGLERVAWIHGWRGEWDQVEQVSSRALAMAKEQGAALHIAASQYEVACSRGFVSGVTNVEQMRQALEAQTALGTFMLYSLFLGRLAECLCRADRFGEALSMLALAQEAAQKASEHFWDAELCRIRGEALIGLNGLSAPGAEDAFHEALAIAREQGAKMLELRSATSLARLLSVSGRCGDASKLLAPVAAWFTEGHDTKDLRDAHLLLDVLAGQAD
jgi:class 3 adenylate cyclase/tetratricopeptide (TPR) repeat protein